MTTLTANLRHWYQCRPMWFYGVYVVFFVASPAYFLFEPTGSVGKPVLFSMCGFLLLGLLSAQMTMGVMQRPLSFCLPGHSAITTRVLFVVGTGVALVNCMLFAVGSRVVSESPVLALAILSTNMVFYWLGAGMTLAIGPASGLLFVAMLVMIGNESACAIVVAFVRDSELSLVAAAIVISAVAVAVLSRYDLRRRYCLSDAPMLLLGMSSGEYRKRVQKQVAAAETGNLAIDDLLMRRILGAAPHSAEHHIWAALYRSCRQYAATMSRPRSFAGWLASILFLTCVYAYLPGMGSMFLCVVPAMMCLPIALHVGGSFPTAIGRRERFFTGCVVGAVTPVAATIFGLAIYAGTRLAEPLMPAVYGLQFTPLPGTGLFLPAVAALAILAGRVAMVRYRWVMHGTAGCLVVSIMLLGKPIMNMRASTAVLVGGVAIVASIAAFSFLLWRITTRWDLVSNRPLQMS